MGLPETFEAVRPSIVAFISRVALAKPVFPNIFGTGFCVDRSGIIATNRHVIEAIEEVDRKSPRNPKTGASPVGALVSTEIEAEGDGHALGVLIVDVIGLVRSGRVRR